MSNSHLTEKSIVDVHQSLDYYMDELFYCKLRFKSHLIGSHYLLYSIEQSIKQNLKLHQMNVVDVMYPNISSHFKTNSQKVERNIRNAIEIAWREMDEEVKNQVFLGHSNDRPTNKEVFCAIYDYIQLHYISRKHLEETFELEQNQLSIQRENDLLLEHQTRKLLYDQLGFKHQLKGSSYLLFYIVNAIRSCHEIYGDSPTKIIYPSIATKFNTSPEKVERAIRNAIESTWDDINITMKKQVFPFVKEYRPTNTEVIYALYEYVKENYQMDSLNKKESSGQHLRFELQKWLEETFHIYSQFGIVKLQILVDSIMIAIEMNGVTDTEMDHIITNISKKYGLNLGVFDLYDGITEIDTVTPLLLKMCEQLYQNDDFHFPIPKDKTCIKTYLNILANQVKV